MELIDSQENLSFIFWMLYYWSVIRSYSSEDSCCSRVFLGRNWDTEQFKSRFPTTNSRKATLTFLALIRNSCRSVTIYAAFQVSNNIIDPGQHVLLRFWIHIQFLCLGFTFKLCLFVPFFELQSSNKCFELRCKMLVWWNFCFNILYFCA